MTLDVGRGRTARAPTAAYPIVFPGNGQTMPFSRCYGIESPDPLRTCGYRGAVGAPPIVQLASIPENVAGTLTRAGRQPLTTA